MNDILYDAFVMLSFRVFFQFPTCEMMALWMSIYLRSSFHCLLFSWVSARNFFLTSRFGKQTIIYVALFSYLLVACASVNLELCPLNFLKNTKAIEKL